MTRPETVSEELTYPLGPPVRYVPWADGRYRVAADLSPLKRDFGNGRADSCIFQFDRDLRRYQENFAVTRDEDVHKYHGETDCAPELIEECARFIANQLVVEYPDNFRLETLRDRTRLESHLTGSSIPLGADRAAGRRSPDPETSSLFALAAEVPEDFALVSVDDRSDRLVALNVAAPSHWDPRQKLGASFSAIHEPVPGMESIRARSHALLKGIARGGAFQRFGWSLTTDDRLNHHPDPPPDFPGTLEEWHGKSFDTADPRLYVRIERQVLAGLPQRSGVLFTIRVYTYDCGALSAGHRQALCNALLSMSPKSRAYKGIDGSFDAIIRWLSEDPSNA